MDQNETLHLPLLGTRSTTKEAKETNFTYYNNIAIFISTTSLFYNILEGAVSVYFGEVNDSISLFFFGVQSFVEVLSSIIVLWKVMTAYAEDKEQIKIEKRSTIFIGCLFIFLAIGILITGVFNLVDHSYPTTTIPNIIVSGVATACMLVLYTVKKKLARELNSSTIQSDAQCSLACIRITIFLLIGSTIFHFWQGGWWIDGAMALVLGILFGKEGIQMLRWAYSKNFNGGCCGGCAKMPESPKLTNVKVVCTTSLQPKEHQYVQDEEPILPKKVDSCCKGGKGKECSKTVGNQGPAPIEIVPEISLDQKALPVVEDVEQMRQPETGKCCKGGKCSKTAKNQNLVQNEVILEPVLIEKEQDNRMDTQPVLPLNEAPKGCCKGGKCSKKSDQQKAAPIEVIIPETSVYQADVNMTTSEGQKQTPIEVVVEVSLEKNDNQNILVGESVSTEQAIIQKPAGKCCKGGKCSKPAEV